MLHCFQENFLERVAAEIHTAQLNVRFRRHAIDIADLNFVPQHKQIADRFANGFNDPRDFFTWFMDPARSASYLETVAGARV